MAGMTPLDGVVLAMQGLDLLGRAASASNTRRAGRAEARERDAAAAARVEDLHAGRAEAERERRAALRRQLARTRARLAGQGVTAEEGSGAALLQGIEREAAEEEAAAGAAYDRRVADVLRRRDHRRTTSLLEREERRRRAALGELARFGERWPRREDER